MKLLRINNDPYIKLDYDKIDEAFLNNGYHRYVFGGFEYIYSKEPLSEEEKRQIEADVQEFTMYHVDKLSHKIDVQILERLRKQGLFTITKIQDNAEGN